MRPCGGLLELAGEDVRREAAQLHRALLDARPFLRREQRDRAEAVAARDDGHDDLRRHVDARKRRVLTDYYEMLLDYHGWTDAGRLIAPGCWPAGAINATDLPQQAYNLGNSL